MKVDGKSILILTVFILFIGGVLNFAQAADAPADDPTLDGGNARLLGLGDAYTAICDDPNAVFLNPAGLASIKSLEIMGMYYTRVFGTYYYLTGAGAMPTPYGTIGLGYVGSGIGGILEVTDQPTGKKFENSNNVFLLSYGTSLGRFRRDWRRIFVGGSAKIFSRGYTDPVNDTGSGVNLDLGLKYIPAQWISLGISKSNILSSSMGGGIHWTTGRNEELTSPTRLGVALRLFEGRHLIGFDMKVPSESERPVLFGLGTEYKLDESFVLRAGLSENIDAASSSRTSWDPSLGLGFRHENLKIDYAYKPYFSDASNTTHYISLSFEEDLSKILEIKVTKFDEEMFKGSNIYSLPGKVYDDLGNVVKGAEVYYHSGRYWKPHLSSLNSIIPVTAQVVDYDTLMAYAFTDIKYAKEEQSPRKYWAGELMPILVEAPYDIEAVVAVMPNGDHVKLLYDEKADAWYAIWRVPKGMKKGLYKAKIVATDFEGVSIVSVSTPFFIEGVTVGGIGTPEAEVITISPEERTRLEAEAKAKAEAEERARLEAQRKAKEEAELKAQMEAEEKAMLEAQRKAEEEVMLDAEERARLEAQRKAEEEARAKAEAEERVRLEAQRKAEEEARLEAEKKAKAEAIAKKEAEEWPKVETKVEVKEEIKEKAKAEAIAKKEAAEWPKVGLKMEVKEEKKEEAELKAQMEAEVSTSEVVVEFIPPEPEEAPTPETGVYVEKISATSRVTKFLGIRLEPEQILDRATVAYIVSCLKGYETENVTERPFKDVRRDFWVAEEIQACKKHGIFLGYPDGLFNPFRKITQIELLCVISDMDWLKDPGPKSAGEYWAAGVLRATRAAGIYDGSVEEINLKVLKKNMTFEEAATLLGRTRTLREK